MNSRADHSTVQDGNDGNADGGIRIFPRRKLHEGEQGAANSEPKPRGRPPLKLGLKAVESQFSLPQKDAAASFGISLTAFKQVCRKLGINRWPYRRQGKALAQEPDDMNADGQASSSKTEELHADERCHADGSSIPSVYKHKSKSVVLPSLPSLLSSRHGGIVPAHSLETGRSILSGLPDALPSMQSRAMGMPLPGLSPVPSSFHFLDLMGGPAPSPAPRTNLPFVQTQPSLNTHPGSNIQTDKGRKWGGHISGCMGTRAADSNSVFGEEFDVMTASNQCQPTLFLAAPLMPTHVSNHHADNKDNVEASFEPVRKDAKVQQHSVMLNTQKASFARVIQADTHHDQPMSTQTMHAHTLNQSHTPRLRLNMQEHALSSMKHGAVQAATNLNSKQPHIEVASPLYNLHIAELEGSEPQLSSRHLGTTINTSFMTPLVSISETLEKNEDATAPLPLAPFDDDKAVVS
mmetsp:Transcript_27052/g.43450  ORF Transcript_27052/g.43450 Transcript_27052/m.43450 type:complete len:463 (-) Transcript_27052:860-2248(-)